MPKPNLVGRTMDRSLGLAPGESPSTGQSVHYQKSNNRRHQLAPRRRGAVIRQDVDDSMALRSDSARIRAAAATLSTLRAPSNSRMIWQDNHYGSWASNGSSTNHRGIGAARPL